MDRGQVAIATAHYLVLAYNLRHSAPDGCNAYFDGGNTVVIRRAVPDR